jgi:hypothetical protein
MTVLQWDKTGERLYETGVDRGVLYQIDMAGDYVAGKAWNGLTAVTDSPSGAEPNKTYADNIEYLNLISVETFGCTIEAYMYPEEFGQNDGSAAPTPGVHVTQQRRKTFGFCWRTRLGNDIEGTDYGYKLHLAWGCMAAPSEKAYATINDSPEAITFSWEVSTTAVAVGTIGGTEYKPTAKITIDSTKVDPTKLAALEAVLYGTALTDAELPSPADVITMMTTALTSATPAAPTYNSSTDIITIPGTTGVEYLVAGDVVPAGEYGPIAVNTEVRARPALGYTFPVPTQTQWVFTFA